VLGFLRADAPVTRESLVRAACALVRRFEEFHADVGLRHVIADRCAGFVDDGRPARVSSANLEDMSLALTERFGGRRQVVFIDRPGMGFSARERKEGAGILLLPRSVDCGTFLLRRRLSLLFHCNNGRSGCVREGDVDCGSYTCPKGCQMMFSLRWRKAQLLGNGKGRERQWGHVHLVKSVVRAVQRWLSERPLPVQSDRSTEYLNMAASGMVEPVYGPETNGAVVTL
jgi:hypothetical protein